MDNGEYILGILVIIAIYIYYIGDVVWGFNIFDRLCKKEKETEHKINARRKSDMVMLQSVEFADSINVAELYDNLCKGGIQGIKSIKKLEIDIGWRWNFMERVLYIDSWQGKYCFYRKYY